MAVTAGIAGANLISQGEVSLVVWEGGSSPCTTVNTGYILIRCHRSVWSARENLSRIPSREWAEGENKGKELSWENRVVVVEEMAGAVNEESLPISSLRRPSPSLSLSRSPLRCSSSTSLSISMWLPSTYNSHRSSVLKNLNRSCHTRKPPNKTSKKKKHTHKAVHYFCLPPQKSTQVQRYKLCSFCFYQVPL